MRNFSNPILPGFYPDPSICRVNEDYYLVTSSFAYYPGVPIFHSKDLVNWKQIGHVLERSSQLHLEGAEHSGGIYAPTLRYHEGIFYMITTNISGEGNFYVTATRPEGPWSDPIVLEAEGIDPSLFFDEDGRVYYVGTREKSKEVSRYYGDNEIWLQELDIKQGRLIGEKYVLWQGAFHNAVWPEGPHLYKKDEYYYLMIAEGGTGHEHSITIARSKQIIGPYEGNPANPILTHRHLGRHYPIVNVGHGDLVQIQDGTWWMVLLGSRPYGGHYRNLGRETFLVNVIWENGWPIVNEGKGIVEEMSKAPDLPWFEVMPEDACTHFIGSELSDKWISLRGPKEDFCSLGAREGYLRIKLRPESIKELVHPSLICLRQQHQDFIVSTLLEFTPDTINEVAGLVLIQNERYHFRYEYGMQQSDTVIRLIKCEAGKDKLIAESQFSDSPICMKIVGRGQNFNFYYGSNPEQMYELVTGVDASILSTDKAGGFVGTCIGMYASSNGKMSKNYADFGWFEYKGNDK